MTVEDIEKAIAKLPPDQLAQFRVWFEEFDSALFDQKIRRDAVSGKLDRLAEQTIDDLRKGRARELQGISRARRFGKLMASFPDTSATSPTRTSRS
jgi:hypothetical protein